MEGEAKGKTFKMKGHTLPGINQRSEGNTDLPDGRSKSSVFQQGFMGVGAAANMGAGAAMPTTKRKPVPPTGGSAAGIPIDPSVLVSKPSMAKDTKGEGSYGGTVTKDKDGKITSASKKILELRKGHNTSPATEDHFGDPHGPKPSMAKIFKKPKGKRTEY